MGFETRRYIIEEAFEEPFDMSLRLQSFMEFLDGVSSTTGSNTEQQHISSNESEKSEAELFGSYMGLELRLAPLNAIDANPRQCYCLDSVHCMCGDLFLPPLLIGNAAAALPQLTHDLTTRCLESNALSNQH
ncbi:hypothetical protein GH5_06274 [Leishmania sp. Ghana 2012 LV757]|uniref:hypothetical protein n=1 Tax=Leishmania sp. Ghana 2012 LV757 TaxID=2803181 RepID=UPI001B7498C1|nr:hypothetical protein GH5_06274 [Leishmania sp. Ghana 2012 LV757]